MNSCQDCDSRVQAELCWWLYSARIATVLCMSTEPLPLSRRRSLKKVRTRSAFSGPCPDFCFFGPPFSDFFRAQGGPKVDFVAHKTGEIVYLELSEMRSPGCEHSHQGTGRQQTPMPIRKVGKRVVTTLKVTMSTGALEPKDITHCFVLKGFPLAWSMLEGANS